MGGLYRFRCLGYVSICLALAGLPGCGGDGGGPGAVNVGEGQPVTLSLTSFKVDQKNLQWAVYPPFFDAISPVDSDERQGEAEAVVSAIARVMRPFIHGEAVEDPTEVANYSSVRNSVDLMTRIIYAEEGGVFKDARASISQAIDRGEPARYQNDDILFTTGPDSAPENWLYTLAWFYIDEARGDDPDVDHDVTDPVLGDGRELRDAVVRVILATNVPGSQISVFPAQTFQSSGPQVRPQAQITSFTLPSEAAGDQPTVSPTATLNQSWTEKEDLWTWTSNTATTFGSVTAEPDGSEASGAKCAHLRVNYESNRAYFYVSEEPSRVGLEGDSPDDDTEGNNSGGDNELCGALDEVGEYRTADFEWAIDAPNR